MLGTDTDQLIRELAYLIWIERGQPLGNPLEDWVRAEQLLTVAQQRYGLKEFRCGLKELPCGLRELV